jgi:hydroxyethylthiazole kinase-like uncharacterized protein yjeF
MKYVLSNLQIREWDKYTISHEPIASIDLMERAAVAFVKQLLLLMQEKEISLPHIYIFCGQGNNGGDGLAIARLLAAKGFSVKVFVLNLKTKGSPDFELNLERTMALHLSVQQITTIEDIPQIPNEALVIEALFGTGLNNSINSLASALIETLNQEKVFRIAVDMPTAGFKANYTFTFEVFKASFLFPETGVDTGEIKVLSIGLHPGFLEQLEDTQQYFNSFEPIKFEVISRFNMKWQKGHALIVAGSYGMMGAAILSAKASLYAGCGMVTVYIPKVGYTILQSTIPEALVQTDEALTEIKNLPNTQKYNALGIGMGMGLHPYTVAAIEREVPKQTLPLLLDADALNAIASLWQQGKTFTFPKQSIITPHAKEFDRLFGKSLNSEARLAKQIEMSKALEIIIVLKGTHTSISDTTGGVWFNLNGHPLLATAGSGDVLSGIITSYLAQGKSPILAARMGVYQHANAAQYLAAKGIINASAAMLIDALPYLEPVH